MRGGHEATELALELDIAVKALEEIFDIEGDQGPGRIAGDALKELGIKPKE